MLRVLIIYELVGTDIKIFELAVTEEQYSMLAKCHGCYINSSDWPPECEWLAEFLEPYYPIYEAEGSVLHNLPHLFDRKIDSTRS